MQAAVDQLNSDGQVALWNDDLDSMLLHILWEMPQDRYGLKREINRGQDAGYTGK